MLQFPVKSNGTVWGENIMKKTGFFLALILILVPVAAHASGPSVLAGVQSVSFGGDLGEYYNIPPGLGMGIIVGFDTVIPVDLRIGMLSGTEENSNDDLTYQWIELGSRVYLGVRGTSIQPDWFIGVGSYSLEIGSKDFDMALGAYTGVGIEEAMEKWIGRVEVKGVFWKSDTGNTDAPSLNVSFLLGYQF
jgi:hypothetical protein